MSKATERIYKEHPYADLFTTWSAYNKAVKRKDTRGQHSTHKAYVKATAELMEL